MMTPRQKNMLTMLIFFGVIIVGVFFYKGGSMAKLGLMDGLLSDNATFTPISNNFMYAAVAGMFWAMVSAAVYESIGNQRDDPEDSSKFVSPKALGKKYRDPKDPSYNKVFSENVFLSYDNKFAGVNSNSVVLGISGGGKTTGYAIPNLLNCSCSYIDIDPKGEHLEITGNRFIKLGYKITVLNLVNFEQSDGYNPFVYIDEDNYQRDIENLVEIIFESADNQGKKKGQQGGSSESPFWQNQARALMLAIMYYVYFEYPKNKQHFGSVMDIKRLATQVMGGDMSEHSPTLADPMFEDLEKRNPDHIALRYWHEYSANQSKVKKDIAATLNSKLSKFNNDKLVDMMRFDDMDIPSLMVDKRVIFIVIPETDKSLNFVVSIFYAQLFDRLYSVSDQKYGSGGGPMHIEFLMDEFFNIKVPDDFEGKLSTMRSRNMSASIIIQNITQLEGVFDKQWQTITGNCGTLLFLGAGIDKATPEYVSELLGKYTLDTSSYSISKGGRGSDSESKQQKARCLLTPGEVRRLPRDKCVVQIVGEYPTVDKKIRPFNYEEAKYTAWDKKEGKKYIREDTDKFTPYDIDHAVTVETGDLSDTGCYFFVSGNELSNNMIRIQTQKEADEKRRLREAQEDESLKGYQKRAMKRRRYTASQS